MLDSSNVERASEILHDAVGRMLFAEHNGDPVWPLRIAQLRAAYYAYESAIRLRDLQHSKAREIGKQESIDELRRRISSLEREAPDAK